MILTPPLTQQIRQVISKPHQQKNQKSNAVTAMPKYDVKKDFSDYEKTDDYYSFIANKLNEVGIIYDALDLSGSDIVKCKTTDKPHRKNGRYICHLKEIITPKGRNLFFGYLGYQNHVTSEWLECKFTNLSQAEYNNNNDTEFKKLVKKALEANEIKRQKAAEKLKQEREFASKLATKIYNESDIYTQHYSAENPHPYFKKKNLYTIIEKVKIIKAEVASKLVGEAYKEKSNYKLYAGSELKGDLLVIPMYNISGEFTSLQLIDINGTKYFLKGGAKSFFEITGNAPTFNNVAVAEGLVTGASIKLALKDYKVFISFDAGNLSNTVGKIVKANSNAKITIFADNDKESHTGEIQAKKAIADNKNANVKYIMPPPDYNDFNDFLSAEFANNNGDINAVISIMKNYIDSEISKEISPFKINDYGVVDESDLGKYSKTIKFSRKKLTATDIENGLSADDAPIKLTAYNIYTALADPKFSGVELKYDVFMGKCEIKRLYNPPKNYNTNDNKAQIKFFEWDDFIKTDVNNFQIRVENKPDTCNYFENLRGSSFYREQFETFFANNSYDSGHEALKKLPTWDGKERLKNFVNDYLNDTSDIDSDYKSAWGIYLFLALFARLNAGKKGIACDTGFGLYQKDGNIGKSWFVKTLALDENWTCSLKLKEISNPSSYMELMRKMRGKQIYLVDEMNGLDQLDNEEVKEFWTKTHNEVRDLYITNFTSYARRGVFLLTTNNDKFLSASDKAIQRRFAFISVNHSYVKKHGNINNVDAGGIKENLLQLYAEAKNIYKKNGGDAYVNDFYKKIFSPLLKKNNSQFINDGGDYLDIFNVWADKVFYAGDYNNKTVPVALPDGYKPKDLPGLASSDVMQFCFNFTKLRDKKNRQILKEVLISKGYLWEGEESYFKTISGKKQRGYINPNFDLNKCKKYSTLDDIDCEIKDSYTSEDF